MMISYREDLLPLAARLPSGRPPLAVTVHVRFVFGLRYQVTHSIHAPELDLP